MARMGDADRDVRLNVIGSKVQKLELLIDEQRKQLNKSKGLISKRNQFKKSKGWISKRNQF
jgi:hypothetical protein